MLLNSEELRHLKDFGYVKTFDPRRKKEVIVVGKIDAETRNGLFHSPYGKDIIAIADEKLLVADGDKAKTLTDRTEISIINVRVDSKFPYEYFHTIIRALRRKEKIFLESYGSEEEFTVAANIYRERYKLVKFSYDFADKSAAAVWEEAERIDVALPTYNFTEEAK